MHPIVAAVAARMEELLRPLEGLAAVVLDEGLESLG